jgi:hypothetical protein
MMAEQQGNTQKAVHTSGQEQEAIQKTRGGSPEEASGPGGWEMLVQAWKETKKTWQSVKEWVTGESAEPTEEVTESSDKIPLSREMTGEDGEALKQLANAIEAQGTIPAAVRAAQAIKLHLVDSCRADLAAALKDDPSAQDIQYIGADGQPVENFSDATDALISPQFLNCAVAHAEKEAAKGK